MKLKFKKKNKGFILVEILLVVGFIALASIGIYAVYNKAVTTAQAQQEFTNLQTIVSGIQQLYANQQNFNGLTTEVVRNARIAPQQMHTGGPTGLVNSFGGKVEINQYGVVAFKMQTTNIPPDVCVKLVSLAHSSPDFEVIWVAEEMTVKYGRNSNLNIVNLTELCNFEYEDSAIVDFLVLKNR